MSKDEENGTEIENGETAGEKPEVSPEEFMSAMDETMKNLGATKREPGATGPAPGGKTIKLDAESAGQLPEMMLNLFATAVQSAQAAQKGTKPGKEPAPKTESAEPAESSNVVNLEEEREKRAPREPTELEKKLQSNIREAFQGYVDTKVAPGAKAGADIPVDGEFIKEHAPALMGTILKSMASAIIPEDGEISIPVKTKEGDGEPVKLKLDLNGFLSKLIPPSEKKE